MTRDTLRFPIRSTGSRQSRMLSRALASLIACGASATAQSPCPDASVSTSGLASAGSRGLLELDVEGAPVVGLPFRFVVRNAPPASPGWLIVIPSLDKPTSRGRALVLDLAFTAIPFVTDAQGQSPPLLERLPVGTALCGIGISARGVVLDPGRSRTIQSKTLRVEVGAGSLAPLFGLALSGPAIGTNQLDCAIGDLDGDQLPDVASLGYDAAGEDEAVAVLFGDGGGSVSPALFLSTGGDNPGRMALGDVDGNGIQDVVTSSGSFTSGGIQVVLSEGGGAFQPSFLATADETSGVTIADMDGDGLQDIVYTRSLQASDDVRVLFAQGGGAFVPSAYFDVARNPIDVVAADLNRDGILDLATANTDLDSTADDGSVSVLIGLGDGTFLAHVSMSTLPGPAFSQAEKIEAADLGLDGWIDLVALVRRQGGSFVSSFTGVGGGAFSTPANTLTGFEPRALALADVDRDLFPDALLASLDNVEGLQILRGAGDGTLLPYQAHDIGHNAWSLAVGDLDGDRMPDVVVTREVEDLVAVVRNGTLLP